MVCVKLKCARGGVRGAHASYRELHTDNCIQARLTSVLFCLCFNVFCEVKNHYVIGKEPYVCLEFINLVQVCNIYD